MTKSTTNQIQRNYMKCKALVETLRQQEQKIEQRYMKENNIVDENGKTPEHIWMILDEKIFNIANEAIDNEVESLGICAAEKFLHIAEDELINYGLSIVPKKVSVPLRQACFGLNNDYVHVDIRQKVIDVTFKLDISTVAKSMRQMGLR